MSRNRRPSSRGRSSAGPAAAEAIVREPPSVRPLGRTVAVAANRETHVVHMVRDSFELPVRLAVRIRVHRRLAGGTELPGCRSSPVVSATQQTCHARSVCRRKPLDADSWDVELTREPALTACNAPHSGWVPWEDEPRGADDARRAAWNGAEYSPRLLNITQLDFVGGLVPASDVCFPVVRILRVFLRAARTMGCCRPAFLEPATWNVVSVEARRPCATPLRGPGLACADGPVRTGGLGGCRGTTANGRRTHEDQRVPGSTKKVWKQSRPRADL